MEYKEKSSSMESLAKYYVSVIQENRSLFEQDLFNDVIDELKVSSVITQEEYSQIMGKEYVPAQNFHVVVERLIECLMTKPYNDIITFVKTLEKNYMWLYQLFQEDITYECVLLGGVPALPKILATRTPLLTKIRESLSQLKRGHFLVLQGMPGCGKTTLAAHCLHDCSVLQHFGNKVLWISTTTTDDISAIHNCINNSHLFSGNVHLSGDVKNDRLALMNALSGSECLIVLDDVQSVNLVEALNLGCKTLITSKDRAVMKKFDAITEYIEVDSSFTLDETLSLFTQAIDLKFDSTKLPFDATSLHTLARGFPLTVSLLVGILEDNKESAVQNNSPIWKNLKELLEKKQYGALNRSSLGNEVMSKGQLNQVISRAVENLGPSFKEKFSYFALFVEDINIKQEVFCTLWNLDELTVQDILLPLVKKSLIVRKWVGNSYVYGIHDIILSYLKETLGDDKTKLHQTLIDRYRAKCPDDDLSKLPQNDNYIFYYIGYHLKAANQITQLIDLYTNLEFIEAKLKVTGPADLLTDYNKYLHNIENQVDVNKVREIAKFIEKCGTDLNMVSKNPSESDIVQFILQETNANSYLYKAALRLASKRSNKSYINFPTGPFFKGNEPSEILPQSCCVTSMKTTAFKDFIIIGYENGSIVLYNTEGKSVINRYAGHEGGPIKGLSLNKDNSLFLSYSTDKRLSIWRLDFQKDEIFNSKDGKCEPRTPSPVTVQENHSPLWQSKATMSYQHLPHQGVIQSAVYGLHNSTLIASSTPQSLMVWKDNQIQWFRSVKDVKSCLFCKNDSLVLAGAMCPNKIIGYSTEGARVMFETSLPVYLSTLPITLSEYSCKITLLMNPEDPEEVLVTTPDVMSLWSFASSEKQFKIFHPINQYRYYELADIGKYIAVAYTDSEIEIFEKENASSLGLFHNQKGEVKCITQSYDKLYAAYNDRTICVWPLTKVNNSLDTSPQPPVDIVWLDTSPHIASFSRNNSILVKKERKLINEICDVKDVHTVKLSLDCKMVVYCHENYLSRSFIEYPQPSTNKIEFHPKILSVFQHQDAPIVLAAPQEGQLLVWCKNKMTFRAQSTSRIQNVYYLKGSIMSVLSNGTVEEYKVDDASYVRCIHQGDVKNLCYRSESCVRNHLAVVTQTSPSNTHILTVYNPFDIVFTESLPSECSCLSFSPDGTYLALHFPDKQFIWMWKDLKGKSKSEIKCPGVVGAMAVSNNGTLCIRTTKHVLLLHCAYDYPTSVWSKASMTTDTPIVNSSPNHPALFATVDSSSILHTITPLQIDVEPMDVVQ